MKKLLILPTIVAIVLLSGCGPSDDAAPAALPKKKKAVAIQPATNTPPTTAPAPASP